MRGFWEQLKQLGTRLRATESGMAELYGVALDAEVEQRASPVVFLGPWRTTW